MEQRVGFGPRLGALLLDCVIVIVLAVVGGGTISGLLGLTGAAVLSSAMETSGADSLALATAAIGGMFGAIFGFVIAAALIGILYFLMEGLTGYTLGKLMLGIRIANADGTAAGVGTLLARYAIKNCNFILTILAVVSGMGALRTIGNLAGLAIFVGCFFTLGMKKQAFHDMIVGTAVYPKGVIKH
jgi:uncharacterized RDD family membrane protein YckC